MAIGDTLTIEGVEYEVVWSGGEGLVPDRESRPTEVWEPATRAYNKSGRYSKKTKENVNVPGTGA